MRDGQTMKTKQKFETLLSAETYREVCLFRNRTREGFISNGVFMKTLFAFLFLMVVIVVGCESVNDPLPQPPKDFIDYKPFTLKVSETYVYARVDDINVPVTYRGLASNGWAGLEWTGGVSSHDPAYVIGKEIYLNYAMPNANVLFKLKFILIQPDKITLQCIERYQ